MRTKLIKSEVIQLFNTTKETLRHYEQMGILKPEVTENNYRFYDFKDLEKLRKIFLLKDLDISLEEIIKLDGGQIKEAEYIELLKEHHITLQKKIHRLQAIQENLQQLVNIHDSSDNHLSFQIRKQKKRLFYIFGSFGEDDMVSPKAYFDKYTNLIKDENYSERTLLMLYPYDALGSGESIESRQCMELNKQAEELLNSRPESKYVLPAGSYLSVFYPFTQGSEDTLPALKKEIEKYLEANNLNRISTMVLELEHPELSMFIDTQTSVYELQLHIKKE